MTGNSCYEDRRPQGMKRFHRVTFTEDAPIMPSVIDTADRIERLIPHLDAMVEERLGLG